MKIGEFILLIAVWLNCGICHAAKPSWYGSGVGPAAESFVSVEGSKFHPSSGSLYHLDRQHRYVRARLASRFDPKAEESQPSRFRFVRCAYAVLEWVRSFAPEQGPITVIKDIIDFKDRDLLTHRYEVDPSVAFASPEMQATVFHGVGALHLSHAGVTATTVRTLSLPKDRRYKEIAKLLKKEGIEPVRIAAETLDFPMSGNFFGHFEFDKQTIAKWGTPASVGQTLGGHLARRQQKYPGRKSFSLGFSAGAAIAGMHELDNYFDLSVLIGPVIPGEAAGYADSRDRLFELAGTLFLPNWEAFYWADTVISQMNWGDREVPFVKPTLILVGEDDTDVPEKTLHWLEQQASRYDYVHFHRIPGAGHNVLLGRVIKDKAGNKIGEYDPTEAYALIHRFLRRYGS